VFRITADSRNAAVVRAAIGRARELAIEVIAEGAETEAHVSFLISAGCELAQGSYFSRPVDAERMTSCFAFRIIDPAENQLRSQSRRPHDVLPDLVRALRGHSAAYEKAPPARPAEPLS